MNHDALIDEVVREHRYRRVLVVAAVVGIVASALGGVAYAIGALPVSGGGIRNPGGLVFFVLPFAVSMTLGGAIFHGLRFIGRRRARRPGGRSS